ncbi:ferroxidase fet3 [Coemansia biformis]|uniref:Ferroxidase fet3 n=1 Tax=Coemansia biformis TaxID=1286918 RepID=A0A9W8CVF9_9FUNG|nr:ferroxidase fet3 [Coemansia biformis]
MLSLLRGCALAWVALLLLAARAAEARSIEHFWDIEEVDFSLAGMFTRKAIGVNGQWPIPRVEATQGDTLVIHVTNKLNEPTSLHAHGIFQNGTNYYDGASMVTECGIPPNGTFTYEIPLQQAGTYWIHSHYKSQTADGLRTPLIIHDPNEVYKYDEEIVLPLEDWFHEPASVMIKQFRNPDPSIRFTPIVPYGLIDGTCINRHRINFSPGKTYRIRLLNIGASFDFHFSIEGHHVRLIEVDGVMVKERGMHGVGVAVGQRASILVTARNTTNWNYMFHADMFTDLLQMPQYNPLNFTGTVEYSPTALTAREPCATWLTVPDLDLEPLDGEPMLEADRQITLNAYSGVFSDQTFRHSFNNYTYVTPRVPTLLTALSVGKDANKSLVYGHQTNAYVLRHMEVVEVTINNHDYYSHPFHIHGHVFQIIEVGSIRSQDRTSKMAQDTPVKRDTVVVHGGQYAVIRFRADNPGVWLLHCHIDFHIMLGLQMTFIEAPDKIQQNMRGRLPDRYKENCIAQGIKTTGNAFGNQGEVQAEEDQEVPTPYPDRFESYEPPSGWKIVSYILGGNKG